MNWNHLKSLKDLSEALQLSNSQKIMLFKHSTRCSISAAALDRIERNWKQSDNEKLVPYYLDLIAHRDISNAIAQSLGIEHQSPQVLIVEKGVCLYQATHQAIIYSEVMNA